MFVDAAKLNPKGVEQANDPDRRVFANVIAARRILPIDEQGNALMSIGANKKGTRYGLAFMSPEFKVLGSWIINPNDTFRHQLTLGESEKPRYRIGLSGEFVGTMILPPAKPDESLKDEDATKPEDAPKREGFLEGPPPAP